MPVKITDIKYEELFSTMVIRPNWEREIIAAAKIIIRGKETYERLCNELNFKMPWYLPGIIHMMECGCRFDRHLHNGDTLTHKTTHVPANRPTHEPQHGKSYSWVESAIDALTMKGFDRYATFTLPEMLYRLEAYNGFGYFSHHRMNSPYLWSGSNHYDSGKYTADGHFDSMAKSGQVGAAILLRFCTDKTLGLVK